MLSKLHIVINFLISIPLLFFSKLEYVLIFFFSSFLIDVDHYTYYVLLEKDLSLKKAYKWFVMKRKKLISLPKSERKKHAKGILIFHGTESLILLLTLSYFYHPFFFIFLGFLVHLIEDEIEDIPLGVMERKLSVIYQIYDYFKKRKYKEN